MSRKYKIYDKQYPHFITSTVINWIDVFTRRQYRDVIIDSLEYCRREKGLLLYAYCIMTNHIHLIIGSEGDKIENIVRDFKSYTSTYIRKLLENDVQESRRKWIVKMMYESGRKQSNNRDFQFWQHHFHPIQLDSNELVDQKMDYIHNNPVKAGFVDKPEDYLYSSAKNYAGKQSVIAIDN